MCETHEKGWQYQAEDDRWRRELISAILPAFVKAHLVDGSFRARPDRRLVINQVVNLAHEVVVAEGELRALLRTKSAEGES